MTSDVRNRILQNRILLQNEALKWDHMFETEYCMKNKFQNFPLPC